MSLLAALVALAPPPTDPFKGLNGYSVAYAEAEASRVVRDFGHCMAKDHPRRAEMILAQEPSSAAEGRLTANTKRQSFRCWDEMKLQNEIAKASFVAMDQTTLRGALAEGLFSQSGRQLPVARPSAQFALHSFPRRDSSLDDKTRQANAVLFGIADCVVMLEPAQVQAVIQTSGQGPQEREAFGKLNPAISSCVPEKQTVSIDKRRLRAALAEALYAATVAPATAAAADKQD